MNVSVGLIEGRSAIEVELTGTFTDTSGKPYTPGRYRFTSEVTLTPSDPATCAFALDDVTIGIGFHWERKERQVFRGAFRLVKLQAGLTVINDVSLEEYVTSVISSEMSASCPLELLKAHAVISRSWLWFPKANPSPIGRGAESGSRFSRNPSLVRPRSASGFRCMCRRSLPAVSGHHEGVLSGCGASGSRDGRRVSPLQRRYLRRTVFQVLRRNNRTLCDRLGRSRYSLSEIGLRRPGEWRAGTPALRQS